MKTIKDNRPYLPYADEGELEPRRKHKTSIEFIILALILIGLTIIGLIAGHYGSIKQEKMFNKIDSKCAERSYEVYSYAEPSCYYYNLQGEKWIIMLVEENGNYYWSEKWG